MYVYFIVTYYVYYVKKTVTHYFIMYASTPRTFTINKFDLYLSDSGSTDLV